MTKKRAKKSKWKRIGGMILLTLLVLCLLAGFAGAIFVTSVAKKSPEISLEDVEPEGYRSSVLDRNGNVVLSLSGQESNRVYVKLEEIPVDVREAFVAIEDNRFWHHHGIDPIGIGRALWRGIKNGGVTEGGSTITQQLIKNNVFTEWASGETFREKVERKIQEQILAIRLENTVDKEWILENYLNTINLGGGNWGVATAADYYFHKDISELSLSEAAVLAGIAKNPTTYNPRKHPENNAMRRKIVLRLMYEQQRITEEAYQAALAEEESVYQEIKEAERSVNLNGIFNYFEDALLREVIADLREELDLEEGEAWDLLYRGGLTVCSSEDRELQTLLEQKANDAELLGTDAQLSLVLIDNESGEVLALIGGRGKKDASLLFNRATETKRQPGSAIKVIGEYAKAFEAGQLTLASVMEDEPYAYSNGDPIHNANGRYGGKTTVRKAIADSNNVLALKTLQKVGAEEVLRQLSLFGVSTLDERDAYEALALGGTTNGVTNLEMTAAYATLARGGKYREPIYFTKVLDHDGKVLLEKKAETRTAVSKETATLLSAAMQDVLTEGTGKSAWFEGPQLAGKSGTTTEIRDAWFLGYSPTLTLGVWGGYDDNQPQSDSDYVKRIWKAVMRDACSKDEEQILYESANTVRRKICMKSGKLAIEGLCDRSLQGDMSYEELFESGTEPQTFCDCHVTIKLCHESGQKATRYCKETEERIYLKEAAAGTADESFVLPAELSEGSCEIHRSFFSQWFMQKPAAPTASEEEEEAAPSEGIGNVTPQAETSGQEEPVQAEGNGNGTPQTESSEAEAAEEKQEALPEDMNGDETSSWMNPDFWKEFFGLTEQEADAQS